MVPAMTVSCEIADGPAHAQRWARSVCALVFREAVVRDGTTYRLLLDRQRLPIHGTGFLVAPNIVATASHVVGSSDAFALVFDFVPHEGVVPDRIDAGHVRDGLRLKADGAAVAPGFVLIQFDDPIIERKPLAISPRCVARDESVFSIGHPAGTTMKYFPPKRVIESDCAAPVFTVGDLGTTCGNSGSPIFSTYQGEGVVGAVSASITVTRNDAGPRSRVTAIRAARLVDAVNAHHPVARRMEIAHV